MSVPAMRVRSPGLSGLPEASPLPNFIATRAIFTFLVHSARVTSGYTTYRLAKRRELGERIPKQEQCKEPEYIQYIDGKGVQRDVKIPEGKLDALVEAVRERSDVEGVLKAE